MFKVLASRIVIFAVAIFWVVGWITMGIIGIETLTTILLSVTLPTWIASFLQVWYVTTIILVGVWAAVKGFRFVGKWEKDDS